MSSVFDRLPPGRPNHPLFDEILVLRKDGHTYDGISYLLSVHRQTVASICQKNLLGGKIVKYDFRKGTEKEKGPFSQTPKSSLVSDT